MLNNQNSFTLLREEYIGTVNFGKYYVIIKLNIYISYELAIPMT